MAKDKEVVEQAEDIYEECKDVVKLRRHSGTFEGRPYTTYYLTIGEGARIKVALDPDKKSLINTYVPFAEINEEVGVD